jgi:hypothetical protein
VIEALSTIALIAVGLAGFAGVAVTLGRGPGRWALADAVRIRALLYGAFGALFASLIPIGLLLAGTPEAQSLRFGSIGLFVVLVSWVITFNWNIRRALRIDGESRVVLDARVGVVILAATVLVATVQLVVGLGFAVSRAPGLFFFGLVALLGYVALGFVRLIFVRPRDD